MSRILFGVPRLVVRFFTLLRRLLSWYFLPSLQSRQTVGQSTGSLRTRLGHQARRVCSDWPTIGQRHSSDSQRPIMPPITEETVCEGMQDAVSGGVVKDDHSPVSDSGNSEFRFDFGGRNA